ncbi:MAG: alpha-amylase MalA [Haloarculaceae archaeon]
MHHPGPPVFTAVGHDVDLSPRDPDPSATYRWTVEDAPDGSRVTLGGEPVEHLVPDVPGTYTVGLDAPDGHHRLTVRAFPAEAAPGAAGGVSGYSGVSDRSGVSGSARGSGRPGDAEGESRPRVRLDGDREGDRVSLRATARRGVEDDRDRDLDVAFYVDDRDTDPGLAIEGWDAELPLPDEPVRVHVVSVSDDGYSVPDAVRVRPDGAIERLYDPPAWAEEVTLYEVYIRGFAGEDDVSFAALEERLPYLADLGVNTVWLTPVLQNDHAPHGYNITDFFSIATDLGTREEFEAFVESAHDHGIRILFDLVLNHSARAHPYFQDAYGNPDSDYYDWYEWQESGEPGTYFDWEYIANFDFDSLEVRRHLLDAVDEWAPVVDGFRCDMAWAVPRSFWREVRDRVKATDSEFLLLDETIPYIADFHGSMFDFHFDTTLYFTLRQVGRGHEPGEAVVDAVEQRQEVGFPDHAGFMLYLENHDEMRYVEECGRAATEAAAGALFTLPGIPMLYSGQELGMRNRRGALDWDAADDSLLDYYGSLVRTRESIPALGYRGGFERIDFESDSDRLVGYARTSPVGADTEHDRYVVACNFGDDPATVSFPGEAIEPTDRVSGESVGHGEGLSVENVVVVPAEPQR